MPVHLNVTSFSLFVSLTELVIFISGDVVSGGGTGGTGDVGNCGGVRVDGSSCGLIWQPKDSMVIEIRTSPIISHPNLNIVLFLPLTYYIEAAIN